MAKEYKVGMVADLLGGGKPPEGKLASLFASRPSTSMEQNTPKTGKSKKKVKGSTRKGKKAPKTKHLTDDSEEENVPEPVKISMNIPEPSQGFQPPAGIVHEAFADAVKKSGIKRKTSSVEDEDGKTVEKRPRRDRLKKATEKRTVFVGNVPLTASKKMLTKLFRAFGEIESVRFRCAPVADPTTKKRVAVILKEFHEQRNNITAYICFKEEESAKKAISLNGHLVDGLHIRVDSAKPQTKQETKRSVFVGNLPFAIEEEVIRKHFEDCGTIENVRVIRDRNTNLGKGFCYILFESKDSVSLALKLQKFTLQGRELRIQRCSDKAKNDGKKAGKKKNKISAPADKEQSVNKKMPVDRKPTKMRNKMWRPTNTSDSNFLLAQKTALKKKWRQADKKKKKKGKTDEITKVLGPVQQPPAGKKSKTMKKKGPMKKKGLKGSKPAKKGKKVRR
ncbi:RNA-binding protein 34-like isoform X2 [Littorina saxatilis]